MKDYSYTPPIVTVDAVLLQLIEGKLSVLLLKRQRDPFKGEWALPGVYNNAGETTLEALSRGLLQKTGIALSDVGVVEQLYAFDSVARDPRGHAISIAYLGVSRDIVPVPGEETQEPQFFPVTDLPKVAFDHPQVITQALQRLRDELEHTNIVFALLPPTFTLGQLQAAYEAVLGKILDKRNFRKKILSLDILESTGEMIRDGAHRPAQTYKFKQQKLAPNIGNF